MAFISNNVCLYYLFIRSFWDITKGDMVEFVFFWNYYIYIMASLNS